MGGDRPIGPRGRIASGLSALIQPVGAGFKPAPITFALPPARVFFPFSLQYNDRRGTKPRTLEETLLIHPTAVVETEDVGENTRIGPFTFIEKGVRIGRNCVIGNGCYIQDGVVLSDGIHIEGGVFVWQGVYLEEDVFVGPHVVFTNLLNPRAEAFPARPEALLQTKIGKGASLGANSTILCGHIIGPYAVVGAGSTLTHSVRAHEVVVGNPARHQGWACKCGETLYDIRVCLRCGRKYEMIDTGLRRLRDS